LALFLSTRDSIVQTFEHVAEEATHLIEPGIHGELVLWAQHDPDNLEAGVSIMTEK
jgi:hypothetical protein